jgi:hypothetical protein
VGMDVDGWLVQLICTCLFVHIWIGRICSAYKVTAARCSGD